MYLDAVPKYFIAIFMIFSNLEETKLCVIITIKRNPESLNLEYIKVKLPNPFVNGRLGHISIKIRLINLLFYYMQCVSYRRRAALQVYLFLVNKRE